MNDDSDLLMMNLWRAAYSHGNTRKVGPWFWTQDEARQWTQTSQRVSDTMRRTVRYESAVITVGGMTEADARDLIGIPDDVPVSA